MGAETFEDILERNRVEIVQYLQLDRTFLFDYLRSKAVFDIGDCDLVHAERTREQKAGKLLDVLMTKGDEGYSHFIDAVQLLNPHLFEKITGEKATTSKYYMYCIRDIRVYRYIFATKFILYLFYIDISTV